MKAAIFFRITLLVGIHQFLQQVCMFLTSTPQNHKAEVALIEMLKINQWSFSGFIDVRLIFFTIYGLITVLWVLIEVTLVWLLYMFSKINSIPVKPIIVVLVFINIVHAILVLNYFFLMPAIIDIIAVLFFTFSFFIIKTNQEINSVNSASG